MASPQQLERREPPAECPAPTRPIEDRVGAEAFRTLHGKEPVHIGIREQSDLPSKSNLLIRYFLMWNDTGVVS
jgi:hypothetical protein